MKKQYSLLALGALSLMACTQQPVGVVYKDGDESTQQIAIATEGSEVSFFPRWNGGNIKLADGQREQSIQRVSYHYSENHQAAAPSVSVASVDLPAPQQEATVDPAEQVSQQDNSEFKGELTFASVGALPSATSNIYSSPQPR